MAHAINTKNELSSHFSQSQSMDTQQELAIRIYVTIELYNVMSLVDPKVMEYNKNNYYYHYNR